MHKNEMGGNVKMHTKSLIKKLLRIDRIVIEDVNFEEVAEEEICIIQARPLSRDAHRCPLCGKSCPGYDSASKRRRWRSLDFGTRRVYIEANAPRIKCVDHGVLVAKVPWARHKSEYTYDFENSVTWLTLHATSQDVSEYFRIDWHTVGSIARRVQESLEQSAPSRFDNLEDIGIDETSYKKGHKYMTVVVDHKTGSLIWVRKGYGKTILTEFFKELTEEQRKSIKHVTGDGAKWISECVSDFCPNAERCVDPFHVVGWATDCLDEVRKVAARKAKKEASKEKVDPVKKKENKKVEKYALLKNPENMTKNQQAFMEMLIKSNKMLYRAYLLKEKLRLVFKHTYDEAKKELNGWLKWAQRCRIPEFVELCKKIKRHKDAILAAIKYGLTNARIEAINNKIKVTIRMGYGYRNIDNLIALVRLKCSGEPFVLPGRKK